MRNPWSPPARGDRGLIRLKLLLVGVELAVRRHWPPIQSGVVALVPACAGIAGLVFLYAK